MAIHPDGVLSWGLWQKGGWSGGKLSCSFASWGLEISLPSLAASFLQTVYWWQQFYQWIGGL